MFIFQEQVFQNGSFDHFGEVLDRIRVQGHHAIEYTTAILKLLSGIDEHRLDGYNSIVSMRDGKNRVAELECQRSYMASKVVHHYQNIDSGKFNVQPFCTWHKLPSPAERHGITCRDCMVDFEIECFSFYPYLVVILKE